jgi:hypothetical protein
MWGQNAGLTAASLNNFVGSRLQTIQQYLEDLHDLKNGWIASNGSAGVQALPEAAGGTQITSADAATMISAVADMDSLWSVFYGNATVANGGAVTVSAGTGHDFSAFAKQGSGFAPHN